MTPEEVQNYLDGMPDEVLSSLKFSMPWQYSAGDRDYVDPDGFDSYLMDKEDSHLTRRVLQDECWSKFHRNPHINTSVRGLMGRLAGGGFSTTSGNYRIQQAIEEIELDYRNRLYSFWPKFIGRSNVEGELFLCLSLHSDGFVEVDFVDPSSIDEGGDDDTGIIFHPNKPTVPLFFNVKGDMGKRRQIPSIFVARYPEVVSQVRGAQDFDLESQSSSKSSGKMFKSLGGYFRFIVSWDKGLLTKRSTSYLRTTLEWLNHYENLKKYEIDHKKSSGSYLWVFEIEEPRTFKNWLTLSDEDRRKTGIMAKKTPGGSIVLPPGIKLKCMNPNLTSIREQDTDILEMVASGLNEPSDVLTGSSKGTYASVKASRGPTSDRISDEIAYFERFLRYDFWGSVFYLKSAIGKFPKTFRVREAVSFKDKEPVFKYLNKKPETLIDISFPVSETIDFEGRAKGLLGVKHGPISDTLGVSNEEVANKLGFGGYPQTRLRKATEQDTYPDLIYSMDAEGLQELAEGESKRKKVKESDDDD